jgi:hypothetical protein
MAGITIILASFAIALIGILRDNKVDSNHRGLFGLNRIGFVLILLSALGVCTGLTKEFSAIRDAKVAKASEEARDRVLSDIRDQLADLAGRSSDPQIGRELVKVSDRLSEVEFGPPEGLAQPGTALADLNRLRNRSEPPKPNDFDTSVDLRRMLAATDERALNQTKAATIEGYVVEVKAAGVTSANMHSAEASRRDTYLYVAPSMQSGPGERVICAVTPRFRAKHVLLGNDWSPSALIATLVGKKCKISGWLNFNFEHVRESANNPQHGNTVYRGTPWELHPVTAIEPQL